MVVLIFKLNNQEGQVIFLKIVQFSMTHLQGLKFVM